jgi:hypothetical protein
MEGYKLQKSCDPLSTDGSRLRVHSHRRVWLNDLVEDALKHSAARI